MKSTFQLWITSKYLSFWKSYLSDILAIKANEARLHSGPTGKWSHEALFKREMLVITHDQKLFGDQKFPCLDLVWSCLITKHFQFGQNFTAFLSHYLLWWIHGVLWSWCCRLLWDACWGSFWFLTSTIFSWHWRCGVVHSGWMFTSVAMKNITIESKVCIV